MLILENSRPAWAQYFMEIAHVVKKRSTCLSRQIGAVIVKDNHIITTGYNGAPSGMKHCLDSGCIRREMGVPSGERHELCKAVHAEQNAIIQAAKLGLSVDGGTLYCTTAPCAICAKMIINAGIKEVIYEGEYPDTLAMEYFNEAMVNVYRYDHGVPALVSNWNDLNSDMRNFSNGMKIKLCNIEEF